MLATLLNKAENLCFASEPSYELVSTHRIHLEDRIGLEVVEDDKIDLLDGACN